MEIVIVVMTCVALLLRVTASAALVVEFATAQLCYGTIGAVEYPPLPGAPRLSATITAMDGTRTVQPRECLSLAPVGGILYTPHHDRAIRSDVHAISQRRVGTTSGSS